MSAIRVGVTIGAPPRQVWRHLEDVASHVRWMHDAEAIRFHGAQRRGVGTAFDCDTRVGPIRLVDRMVVTEWRPRRAMGVRHRGAVSGTGRFTLRRLPGGRTRCTWREELAFPWWLGGRVGAVVGGEVLRLVWAGNLRRLKALVEASPGGPGRRRGGRRPLSGRGRGSRGGGPASGRQPTGRRRRAQR